VPRGFPELALGVIAARLAEILVAAVCALIIQRLARMILRPCADALFTPEGRLVKDFTNSCIALLAVVPVLVDREWTGRASAHPKPKNPCDPRI